MEGRDCRDSVSSESASASEDLARCGLEFHSSDGLGYMNIWRPMVVLPVIMNLMITRFVWYVMSIVQYSSVDDPQVSPSLKSRALVYSCSRIVINILPSYS